MQMPMNQPQAAHERRVTTRLLAYWEKQRRGRPMPGESEISAADLHELWDHCFLVRIHGLQPEEYRYDYLGPALREAYRGKLASGAEEEGVISPNAGKLADAYAKIAETGKPLIEEGEFENHSGETIRYRQCLLPLGEGATVKAVFGAMRFKVFSA